MGKKLFVCKNTGDDTPWSEYTQSHIEKFIEREKDTFEVIEELVFNEDDEVYIVGYKTSEIVDKVIKMRANGTNANLIENLCYDDSVKAHRAACDKMFLNGIPKNRTFKFLNNEIKEVLRTTVIENCSQEVKNRLADFDENKLIISMQLDSLDLLFLVDAVENEFNTSTTKVSFTKPIKIKEVYSILDNGFIGDKFNK